jgi:hypothetical protein
MGGGETKISLVPIFESQELFPVNLPPSAFLPKLSRRSKGQQEFLGSGPIHFFSDNIFNLADNPQSQR